jgi:hypothetical protein
MLLYPIPTPKDGTGMSTWQVMKLGLSQDSHVISGKLHQQRAEVCGMAVSL